MNSQAPFLRVALWLAVACLLGALACQITSSGMTEEEEVAQAQGAQQPSVPNVPQLVIDTTTLPTAYPRIAYSARLQQHGGTPPFHWRVEKGELPSGLKLEDDGTLHGTPEKTAEYRFTISVTDSGKPPQAVQREYTVSIVEAFTMTWKTAAHVNGNRIEGSVEVSNTTGDDLDLTFITLAVNEFGRATAIGYQHFPLRKRTADFEIPFGDTVPHGAYIVHVDGVAEMPEKNQIHRVRLQTPGALQVAIGP